VAQRRIYSPLSTTCQFVNLASGPVIFNRMAPNVTARILFSTGHLATCTESPLDIWHGTDVATRGLLSPLNNPLGLANSSSPGQTTACLKYPERLKGKRSGRRGERTRSIGAGPARPAEEARADGEGSEQSERKE
jgi:hypothetical protein